MTTLQQLDQPTLQRIDEVMTRHCLEMATKMASPTWQRHIFWVMTIQHELDWEALVDTFGSSQPLLGYPDDIYMHHNGWLHFVGENSTHKFFMQKRAKGWVKISVCCELDEVRFSQVTSTSVYTGKLGWDIDIDLSDYGWDEEDSEG